MIQELPTNEDRARRASDLLTRYNIENNGKDGDLETSAGDLLADILHLADRQDWEPRDRFIDRGRMHHRAESTGIEPEPAMIPPPLADPTPCLRADHDVVAFWPTDTIGYLHWTPEGFAEIFDTEALEPGPTDAAECRTCSIQLDPEGLDI